MSKWRYGIVKVGHGETAIYQVCEIYSSLKAHTGPVEPLGETPEELKKDLEMMLQDVQRCIDDEDYVEE